MGKSGVSKISLSSLTRIVHRFLSRSDVGVSRDRQDCKTSGVWEAPQVPDSPQAEACGSDRVAENTNSGGFMRDKQSRGL